MTNKSEKTADIRMFIINILGGDVFRRALGGKKRPADAEK